MPHDIPWRVQVQTHPGSSAQDIEDEPDWQGTGQHRIGYRNRQDRLPGFTHDEDEGQVPELTTASSSGVSSEEEEEEKFDEEAKRDFQALQQRASRGDLLNFRDIIGGEKDFHLRYPANRSLGWRYVLDYTEDWVKNEEDWPANVKKRKKVEEARRQEEGRTADGVQIVERDEGDKVQDGDADTHEETDWKQNEGGNSKHHDAYAADDERRVSFTTSACCGYIC